MINLDSITNGNNKEHNKKWPFIPDHLYRILIIDGSGSGKINAFLNLISQQDGIDKIYLYAKDLKEPKYEFLIKKCEDLRVKTHLLSVLIKWMTFMRILQRKQRKKNLNHF